MECRTPFGSVPVPVLPGTHPVAEDGAAPWSSIETTDRGILPGSIKCPSRRLLIMTLLARELAISGGAPRGGAGVAINAWLKIFSCGNPCVEIRGSNNAMPTPVACMANELSVVQVRREVSPQVVSFIHVVNIVPSSPARGKDNDNRQGR